MVYHSKVFKSEVVLDTDFIQSKGNAWSKLVSVSELCLIGFMFDISNSQSMFAFLSFIVRD